MITEDDANEIRKIVRQELKTTVKQIRRIIFNNVNNLMEGDDDYKEENCEEDYEKYDY